MPLFLVTSSFLLLVLKVAMHLLLRSSNFCPVALAKVVMPVKSKMESCRVPQPIDVQLSRSTFDVRTKVGCTHAPSSDLAASSDGLYTQTHRNVHVVLVVLFTLSPVSGLAPTHIDCDWGDTSRL